MTAPLLTTKLNIPPPRPNLVPRPRLVERLNAGLRLGHRLTLVSAPAGFGKTTLLSAWARSLEARVPLAWISLDEEDSDPLRFATYLVAALRTLPACVDGHNNLGEDFIDELRSPRHVSSGSVFPVGEQVAILINDIATLDHDFVLVLDDYHVLADPRIHEGMAFFLDHQPPHMHLVVAGRAVPPLPLARLRARGQLTELRVDDLRFTPDEVTTFLNQTMGLDLPAEHVALLEARTEGWIAGLQMAALSVQGREDPAGFIHTFAGDDRHVLDYLVQEVLDHQPGDVRDFLLRTSILERLSGPLCDAVTGQSHGQATLETLERHNLFIVPLDNRRQWYRYHQLFVDLLRYRLAQGLGAQERFALHRRAAEWCELNGLTVDAVNYALKARDYDRAVRLIEGHAEPMFLRNEMVTLRNWLRALPQDVVLSRPLLCIAYGWTSAALAQLDDAERWVKNAESALGIQVDAEPIPPALESLASDPTPRRLLGHIGALRAVVASNHGQDDRTIALAQWALEYVPPDDALLRSILLESLGEAHARRNETSAARRAYSEAIAIGEEAGNVIVTLVAFSGLGSTYAHRGDLSQAAAIHRRGIRLGAERGSGGRPVPATGVSHKALASILYQWNDLDTALHHAVEGVECCRRWGHVYNLLHAYEVLAFVQHARGDEAAAHDTATTAQRFAQTALATARQRATLARQESLAWHVFRAAGLRARLWLMQGDVDAAARWVAQATEEQKRATPDDDPLPYLVLPRLHVAQGNPEEALRLLQPALQRARAAGAVGETLNVLGLQACAFHLQGRAAQALAVLEQALQLGEPGRYVRTFVDQGAPLAHLLPQAAARGISPDYVGHLLAAFETNLGPGTQKPDPLLEPLSERERQVLRLIAANLSNQAIADTLFISINTVKTHVKRLYGKLNVSGRLDAVERARALDLL
jgi:LuxR family maltose regulon positive regulatory protein